MTLQRAVLELDAMGTTGVFEMVGNLELQESIETNYFLASGQGSTLNAVTSNTINEFDDFIQESDSQDTAARAGFYLDLGGGRHTFELNFIGWEGAVDKDGNTLQWGDGSSDASDPSDVTRTDATGADPLSQVQVFTEYLRIGEYDSRATRGRLRVGEYSDGTYATEDGVLDDYIQVVIPRAQMTRVAEDPVAFDGSIQLWETKNWTDVFEAIGKVEW